jgi:alpha-beta hydrolase superfamily lysophospholipase
MEFNIKLNNGLVLKGFIKSPGSDLRAVVVLVHGLGEHIERYREWADLLNEQKIAFTGVDLPGHGRSNGKRGHIRSYSVTDEMITVLLQECRKTFPGIPLFIYGNSLGGGIVLDYIIRKKPSVRGAIVTSPWLRLSFEPDKFKVKLAAFMKSILPSLVQPSGLNASHLSHDEEVVRKYKSDPLVHDKISVSLFDSAMKAGEYCLKNAGSLKIPLLLMHGSDDKICSPEASMEFARNATLAETRIWDGGYHELHNELFRMEVFNYIMGWINSKLL